MNTRIKYTLLKRNKKYNYKVYEEQRYNNMSGYEYSYLIEEYNTGDVIMSGLIDWHEVEEILEKIRQTKESEQLWKIK